MSKLQGLKEWILPMAVAIGLAVILRVFVFNVNVVQGTSMCTTLYNGDVLVAQKLALNSIHRGDIVTAYSDSKNEFIVKRVIGLPGESIHIDENGYIYADGVLIDEQYQSPTVGMSFTYSDIDLGENEYFLVGDNRYNSYDSRYFGAIDKSNIRDIAVFRFFPLTLYCGSEGNSMKDYRKDELRAKWNQMDSKQRGRILSVLVVVFIVLFSIVPGFAFVATIVGVALCVIKAKSTDEKQKENQRSIGFGSPETSVRSLPANIGYSEDDIDQDELGRINAMNVPPVVKYKLIQVLADDGGMLEDVLDNPDVPDVMKRYVQTYLDQEETDVTSQQGFDVSTFTRKQKDEPEIYNPDEYESVNVDLSSLDDHTMIVNGKPVNFKNRKNPFEM